MKIAIEQNYRMALRVAGKVLLLFMVLLVLFGVIFGLWRVKGVAMAGRVADGDLVLFMRHNIEFMYGDVVIYRRGGKRYMSKIVAGEGAVVTVDEEGYIEIDGERETEVAAYDVAGGEKPKLSLPFRVPAGGYFVLNENLEALEDSREFGAILETEIEGKAIGLLRTRTI